MKITLFFLLLFLEYYIIALNTFPFWRNFLNQNYWTKYNSRVHVHWKMTGNNEFSLVIFKTNSSGYTKYTDEHKLHLASCLLFMFCGHPSSLSVFIHLSAEDVWGGGGGECYAPPPHLLLLIYLYNFIIIFFICSIMFVPFQKIRNFTNKLLFHYVGSVLSLGQFFCIPIFTSVFNDLAQLFVQVQLLELLHLIQFAQYYLFLAYYSDVYFAFIYL